MKPVFLLLSLLLITALPAAAQTPHTLTGDFVQLPRFHSRSLPDDRDVLVWLPPGYGANPKLRYPVLYLHDGQNLFDGATAFLPGREWRADETATELLTSKQIEPLIIVGIYNTGARMSEYTPTKDAQGRGGDADAYGKLIVTDLKPYIDSHFRTLPDAAHTGLGGSSLGGLVSLYLGLKHPEVFGKIACLSSSAWWDNGMIIKDVQALPKKTPTRIWLDIGIAEGNDAIGPVRKLRAALVSKGWKEGRDLQYTEAIGAAHNEEAWAKRFGSILIFLFPRRGN